MKYTLFWVFSLLVIVSCHNGPEANITVKGRAAINDIGIRGAPVVIYEYIPRVGMPDVIIHALIATDREGRFETRIAHQGGALDIQLLEDRCDWVATSKLVEAAEIKAVVEVTLDSKQDDCDKADCQSSKL